MLKDVTSCLHTEFLFTVCYKMSLSQSIALSLRYNLLECSTFKNYSFWFNHSNHNLLSGDKMNILGHRYIVKYEYVSHVPCSCVNCQIQWLLCFCQCVHCCWGKLWVSCARFWHNLTESTDSLSFCKYHCLL